MGVIRLYLGGRVGRNGKEAEMREEIPYSKPTVKRMGNERFKTDITFWGNTGMGTEVAS